MSYKVAEGFEEHPAAALMAGEMRSALLKRFDYFGKRFPDDKKPEQLLDTKIIQILSPLLCDVDIDTSQYDSRRDEMQLGQVPVGEPQP